MKTKLKEKPINNHGAAKYCSDYDETCKEIKSPSKCFLGGTWTCDNGYTSDVALADGVCREAEIRGDEE